jgi:hypothetical protein
MGSVGLEIGWHCDVILMEKRSEQNQLLRFMIALGCVHKDGAMPKVDDRIQALEAKLKQLKVVQQRKEARARSVALHRSRRDELRRKILVGAVVGTEPRGPGRRRPIALRSPCSAQAQGGLPWPPVRRIRLTPGACGKNFLFFTPRPASSRPHSCWERNTCPR